MDPIKAIEAKFGSVRMSAGSNGTEYLVVCPHCGKRKLSINLNKGLYQCWHGCCSGRLSTLLHMKLPNVAPVIAKKRSYGYIEPGETVKLSLLSSDHQANLYIKARGFDQEYLENTFGVCWCKTGKKFAGGTYDTTNTLILPVTRDGKQIGWQSRLLYNPDDVPEDSIPYMGWKFDEEENRYVKPSKYMTMPGYDKQANLYNYDLAKEGEMVVVTEGAFDCMAVGKCAVATFGKGVSDGQVEIIKNIWKVAVLLLDPDAEAAQMKLQNKLSRSVITLPVKLVGYKDAGECPQAEIWKQINQAVKSDRTLSSLGLTLQSMRFKV